jgi:uncharacterized metal-binding protein
MMELCQLYKIKVRKDTLLKKVADYRRKNLNIIANAHIAAMIDSKEARTTPK